MKEKINKYFLEETLPFAPSRKVRWKRVKIVGGGAVFLTFTGLLVFTPNTENQNDRPSQSSPFSPRETGPNVGATNLTSDHSDPFAGLGGDPPRVEKPTRVFTASQIVRRGEGASGGEKLPMGSTIAAKLINSVLSSDSNSPLISEILEDIFWKGTVLIPAGTRAIGQGLLDDGTERLQARFHTLVYPEGDQHSISAIGLLGDGSSGIAGNFYSRGVKKQAGRFFGNFIGGLAQGMTDKDSRGQAGIVFEPGSLKNGLLNGLATSSFDQAKSFADDTQNLKPYLEVPGGTTFLIYLEKEFSP